MNLREAYEKWGADFEYMEPKSGNMYVDLEILSDYLEWIDLRGANIGAIRIVPATDGKWTIAFLQVSNDKDFDTNGFTKIEDLWPNKGDQ